MKSLKEIKREREGLKESREQKEGKEDTLGEKMEISFDSVLVETEIR